MYMYRCIVDSPTITHIKIHQEMFAEVSRLYNDLDQGITPISVFFPNLPIPSHFRRDAARKEMVKLFSKVRPCYYVDMYIYTCVCVALCLPVCTCMCVVHAWGV